jgi:hypothetical protein
MSQVYDLGAYRAIVKGVQEFFLKTQVSTHADVYCQHDTSRSVDISCKHDDTRRVDDTLSPTAEEYAMPPKGWTAGREETEVKAVRLPKSLIERITQHVERLQVQFRFGRINEGMAIRDLLEVGLDTVEARASQPQPAQVPLTTQPALPIGLEGVPASQAPPAPDRSPNVVVQESVSQPPVKRKGGRPSTKRQPILALLREHPEGLTAEQIRAYLDSTQPLGDTLEGMRRSGAVRFEGIGHAMRYFTKEQASS